MQQQWNGILNIRDTFSIPTWQPSMKISSVNNITWRHSPSHAYCLTTELYILGVLSSKLFSTQQLKKAACRGLFRYYYSPWVYFFYLFLFGFQERAKKIKQTTGKKFFMYTTADGLDPRAKHINRPRNFRLLNISVGVYTDPAPLILRWFFIGVYFVLAFKYEMVLVHDISWYYLYTNRIEYIV